MQEEITQGAVALSVKAAKITAELLQQMMKKALVEMKLLHLLLDQRLFFLRHIELDLYFPCPICHSPPPCFIRVWDYPNKHFYFRAKDLKI